MNSIRVKLFGAFKDYVPEGYLEIQLHGTTTKTQLKMLIVSRLLEMVPHFQARELVIASVLATNEDILQEDDVVNEYRELALLPPVCGG